MNNKPAVQPSRFKRIKSLLIIGISSILIIILAIAGYLFLKPVPDVDPDFGEFAVVPYTQAVARANIAIDESTASESGKEAVSPTCQSQGKFQQQKPQAVVIIFHGFTNCPKQFDQLGTDMFDEGYNVYVPRMPRHGYEDVLTEDVANLTTDELVTFIEESIQIGKSLGDEVILMGLSGGAVMAAWGGYNSVDVDHVFLNAPLFAPSTFSQWQLPAIYNAIETVDLGFRWWDPELEIKRDGPDYAYPQFSYNAVNAFMGLSLDLKDSLDDREVDQSDKQLTLVTVEGDEAVNNQVTAKYIEEWTDHSGVDYTEYEFKASTKLNHDFIDPNQSTANPEFVYPKIIELL